LFAIGVTFVAEGRSRAFYGEVFALSTLVDFLGGSGMKESSAGTQSSITSHVKNVRAIPVVADMPGGGFRWWNE
jgi:hypothetical protein